MTIFAELSRKATTKTLYEVLGVAESASAQDVKRAYRNAAMRWHPDRNQGNEAEASARFAELSQARTVLSDPSKRAEYDRALASVRQRPQMADPSAPPEPTPNERWLNVALSVTRLGLDRETLIHTLVAQGCAPELAKEVAEKAIAMRAQSAGTKAKRAAAQADRKNMATRVMWGLAAVIAVALLFGLGWENFIRSKEAVMAAASSQETSSLNDDGAPTSSWTALLPREVTSFTEATGTGQIRYSVLPEGKEFDLLRTQLSQPFKVRLLQSIALAQDRQLLLFASAPATFDCEACRPILSAMTVKGTVARGFSADIPLRAIATAGEAGALSLEGEHRARLIGIGPGLEAFVFRDVAAGHDSDTGWARLFAVEAHGIRPLGGFDPHTASLEEEFCEGPEASRCAKMKTSIRLSSAPGPGGLYDIVVVERPESPAGPSGNPSAMREYASRFDGQAYQSVILPGSKASTWTATSASPARASSPPP